MKAAEPLLVAHMAGRPLVCALPHPKGKAPEAITLVLPGGLPACQAHVDGTVAP